MKIYSLSEDYLSNLGRACAGTDLVNQNGKYFLPLDSGAVVHITPAQLQSRMFESHEYPDWMDAADPRECRVAASPSNGGVFMFSIEGFDGTYLDTIPFIEVNGRKFKRA